MITMKVNIEEMRSLYAAPFGVAVLAHYRAVQKAFENFSNSLYDNMINKENKPFRNRTHVLRKSSRKAEFAIAGGEVKLLNSGRGLIGKGVPYTKYVETYVLTKSYRGEFGRSFIVGYFVNRNRLLSKIKIDIKYYTSVYYNQMMSGNKYSIAQYARRGKEILNRQRVLYV